MTLVSGVRTKEDIYSIVLVRPIRSHTPTHRSTPDSAADVWRMPAD